MTRLIDADELKKKARMIDWLCNIQVVSTEDIDNAPTVDINTELSVAYLKGRRRSEERLQGEWIDHSDEAQTFAGFRYEPPMTCSRCGRTALNEPWSFCPNCGADMRGGRE